MSDIALTLVNNCFDIDIENDDLLSDDGLETAVAISIFTDRRVKEEELPDLETNKRGWWGDMIPEIPQDRIGSRLWTIQREKTTTEILRRSEELIKEALDWMLEDGVATDVNVSSSFSSSDKMDTIIEILKPDDVESTRYQVIWEAQEIRRI